MNPEATPGVTKQQVKSIQTSDSVAGAGSQDPRSAHALKTAAV